MLLPCKASWTVTWYHIRCLSLLSVFVLVIIIIITVIIIIIMTVIIIIILTFKRKILKWHTSVLDTLQFYCTVVPVSMQKPKVHTPMRQYAHSVYTASSANVSQYCMYCIYTYNTINKLKTMHKQHALTTKRNDYHSSLQEHYTQFNAFFFTKASLPTTPSKD